MSRTDFVRRALSLTAAVVCLVLGPGIADAGFVATQQQSLTVGTASMSAPTAFTGTYSCEAPNPNAPKDGSVSVSVATVTGAGGPFRVTLSGGTLSASADKAAVPIPVALTILAVDTTVTWTVSVRSLGSSQWASSPLVKTFTCKGSGKDSGTF